LSKAFHSVASFASRIRISRPGWSRIHQSSAVHPRHYQFDNFKSRMRILGSLTARTSLRAYLLAALAERVQNVISFGTIKEPTSLIPPDIHSPRALEYDSGIKRRLYDYSPYDSLTGSLCRRQLREEGGNEREERAKRRRDGGGRGERQNAAAAPVLLPEASPSARIQSTGWFIVLLCHLSLLTCCVHVTAASRFLAVNRLAL